MISNFYGYSGISDSLAGTFEALVDQEGLHGKRYRQADIWTLLKDIAERRFASGIYELCHLLRGFGQLDRRGEAVNIFWMVDAATPTSFGTLLESHTGSKRLTDTITIDQKILKLSYPDSTEFHIKRGRMPYLAALFDFMVNAIGFVEIHADLKTLTAPDLTHRQLSDISNRLYSMVYGYLQDHLPPSQGQRKMRHILTFISAYHGKNFTLDDITDETIMAFWEDQDFNTEGEGNRDFIRFSTVFDDFTRYAQSTRELLAKRNVVDAKSIGTNIEGGEVDPSQMSNDDHHWAEEADDILARLEEPPLDDIRFLSKKEMDILRDILERPLEVSIWVRSYLRALSFGQGQSRISQALRNKVDANTFQSLCGDSAVRDYADIAQQAHKLSENVQTTHLACLYVVTTLHAKEKDAPMVELNFQAQGKARKSFHNITRQGFHDTVLDEPDNTPAYEVGADCLDIINSRYNRIVKAIKHVDASLCYNEDKPRFAQRFHKIYGGHG